VGLWINQLFVFFDFLFVYYFFLLGIIYVICKWFVIKPQFLDISSVKIN
jgi:hypothetical protein